MTRGYRASLRQSNRAPLGPAWPGIFEFVKPQPLTRVAIYRRELSVSIERVWENVFDWEHLPWLHRTRFRSIERVASGPWGWRTWVGLHPQPADSSRSSSPLGIEPERTDPEILLELLVDRTRLQYVARTLEGPGANTEIWTRLEPHPEGTGIEVQFLVPGVDPAAAEGVGAVFTRLYRQLWDEDEAMMNRREAELSRSPAREEGIHSVEIGCLDEVRGRVPFVVNRGGRRYRIVELSGRLVAHATECPHMLGPLAEAPIEHGCVVCPWHGYRYDLDTGESADGRGLRLAPAPDVRIDADQERVFLEWDGVPRR